MHIPICFFQSCKRKKDKKEGRTEKEKVERKGKRNHHYMQKTRHIRSTIKWKE
jgi:hypothetical protein